MTTTVFWFLLPKGLLGLRLVLLGYLQGAWGCQIWLNICWCASALYCDNACWKMDILLRSTGGTVLSSIAMRSASAWRRSNLEVVKVKRLFFNKSFDMFWLWIDPWYALWISGNCLLALAVGTQALNWSMQARKPPHTFCKTTSDNQKQTWSKIEIVKPNSLRNQILWAPRLSILEGQCSVIRFHPLKHGHQQVLSVRQLAFPSCVISGSSPIGSIKDAIGNAIVVDEAWHCKLPQKKRNQQDEM